ncbi:MAG: hypothetical protein DRR42_22530 [Gammaproteobacteria bacterium]|nr:MAG: hypothetical protein DRR42_22530 [Gammaproteobacteria bacterium]
MRKDSLVIFSISIVLSLGIVGGTYYLYLQKRQWPPNPAITEPPTRIDAGQATGRTAVAANRRTATPIKCTKPDGSVFWTNATRCEGADLDNRLSFADPVKPVPRVRVNDSQSNKSNPGSSRTSSPAKKKLEPIPKDMKIQCSFPIGMARKIETRSLNLKSEPSESVWKKSYCRWICEARVENCGNLEEYLNLANLCPRAAFMSKRACGT